MRQEHREVFSPHPFTRNQRVQGTKLTIYDGRNDNQKLCVNTNCCSSKNSKQLPLPPYGKEAALLQSYKVLPRNDIFICAGIDGWRKAKACSNNQIVLCLPYDRDPNSYFWPVSNCPVLLIDTGFLSIFDVEKIAYCLLCANATIVRAILFNNKLVIYGNDA